MRRGETDRGRGDWSCDVQTRFASANLGCTKRVVSGLDWVFENAERCIIIEDDCLPSPDFSGSAIKCWKSTETTNRCVASPEIVFSSVCYGAMRAVFHPPYFDLGLGHLATRVETPRSPRERMAVAAGDAVSLLAPRRLGRITRSVHPRREELGAF